MIVFKVSEKLAVAIVLQVCSKLRVKDFLIGKKKLRISKKKEVT